MSWAITCAEEIGSLRDRIFRHCTDTIGKYLGPGDVWHGAAEYVSGVLLAAAHRLLMFHECDSHPA